MQNDCATHVLRRGIQYFYIPVNKEHRVKGLGDKSINIMAEVMELLDTGNSDMEYSDTARSHIEINDVAELVTLLFHLE